MELFDPSKGSIACIKEWQKKYGRIIPVLWFWDPMLIVTDPDVLKEITVKDFNNWTDRYLPGHGDLQQKIVQQGVFFSKGMSWKRIRRIMTPTFNSTKLKNLTLHMNLTSRRLADKLKEFADAGRPASAKNCFGAFALDVICGTAFGLDTDALTDAAVPFMTHAQGLMKMDKYLQIAMMLVGIFPWMSKVFKMLDIGFFKTRDVNFFKQSVMDIIKERKEIGADQKHSDFLQLLLNAEASDDDEIIGDKKLTVDEIAAQGLIFIIGGYETTSSALQFLSYELAKNQHVQDKVAEEIESEFSDGEEPNYYNVKKLKYMEAVINETLRMFPPVHSVSRIARVDTTINGRPVPAGTGIIIPVANIGRDPEFFPEPDSFRPERFMGKSKEEVNPLTFLPFGHGPRHCIGFRLAMMEIQIALVHMLRKVRVVSATPETVEIEEFTGVMIPKIPIQLKLQSVM